ncbi:unnamed protein product [Caenorhabditis angaria]|uniref:Uncharacterized protein n=1 Tax=Caenorhabditis angaria TaxID=860376 RepID=A0A9P1N1G6_9PELO|nr:unnamed protein product [Caenorhabditis angaria]
MGKSFNGISSAIGENVGRIGEQIGGSIGAIADKSYGESVKIAQNIGDGLRMYPMAAREILNGLRCANI